MRHNPYAGLIHVIVIFCTILDDNRKFVMSRIVEGNMQNLAAVKNCATSFLPSKQAQKVSLSTQQNMSQNKSLFVNSKPVILARLPSDATKFNGSTELKTRRSEPCRPDLQVGPTNASHEPWKYKTQLLPPQTFQPFRKVVLLQNTKPPPIHSAARSFPTPVASHDQLRTANLTLSEDLTSEKSSTGFQIQNSLPITLIPYSRKRSSCGIDVHFFTSSSHHEAATNSTDPAAADAPKKRKTIPANKSATALESERESDMPLRMTDCEAPPLAQGQPR
jgi:hypothetical protein